MAKKATISNTVKAIKPLDVSSLYAAETHRRGNPKKHCIACGMPIPKGRFCNECNK